MTRQNSTSYKGKQRRPAPTREGSVHGAPIGPRVKRSRTELGSKKEQRAAAWRGEKHEYSSMQEVSCHDPRWRNRMLTTCENRCSSNQALPKHAL